MMQPNLKAEGYKHGRNGWEIARPDCADYMDGYNAGNKGYKLALEDATAIIHAANRKGSK